MDSFIVKNKKSSNSSLKSSTQQPLNFSMMSSEIVSSNTVVVEPNKSQMPVSPIQKHKLDRLPSLVQFRKPLSQNRSTGSNFASQDDPPLADLERKFDRLFSSLDVTIKEINKYMI